MISFNFTWSTDNFMMLLLSNDFTYHEYSVPTTIEPVTFQNKQQQQSQYLIFPTVRSLVYLLNVKNNRSRQLILHEVVQSHLKRQNVQLQKLSISAGYSIPACFTILYRELGKNASTWQTWINKNNQFNCLNTVTCISPTNTTLISTTT